jgi:hypothetical protein
MRSEAHTTIRVVDVPTTAAAAQLLMSVHVARIVMGRSREPGVEAWMAELRTALTAILSPRELDVVLDRCRQLEEEMARAA